MTETEYPEYVYECYNSSLMMQPHFCIDEGCIFYTVAYLITFVLGVAGNGLVIWIAGFKMKKSVVTTWYLSLAVSNFLFCSFLPFDIVSFIKNNWIVGLFRSRYSSYIMCLNMYNSIFLLVIISVDCCVVVMFPVWAQNQRTVRKAVVIVMLAWIISAALSSPLAVFQDTWHDDDGQGTICFTFYTSKNHFIADVACRFVFGFVIPFLIIVTCYVVINRKLETNQMARSKKPFIIMTALIVTFFICWLPFHSVALMELNYKKYIRILPAGESIGFTLASANSCLNPFLYAFMGKDIQSKCCALQSNIENAIEEEEEEEEDGPSIDEEDTAVTTFEEGKASANA